MLVVDGLGTLQIYRRVFVVKAIFDPILNFFVAGVGLVVFVCQLVNLPEGQQGLKLEGGGLEIVEDGVFDNQPFFGVGEQDFLGEVEMADPKMIDGDNVGVEFLQVFVAFGVENAAFVLVHAKVELHVIDDDALVQGGDQHMAFAIDILLRQNEQSVVFSGIETEQGGGSKSPGAAATDYFLFLREGNVDQFCLVKFYIAHFRYKLI